LDTGDAHGVSFLLFEVDDFERFDASVVADLYRHAAVAAGGDGQGDRAAKGFELFFVELSVEFFIARK
jgi:hypothetical protein